MENIEKCFEVLKAFTANAKGIEESISNLTELQEDVLLFQKFLNISNKELYNQPSLQRHSIGPFDCIFDHDITITHYLFHTLLSIKDSEEPLNERNKDLFSNSLFKATQFGVLPTLDDRVVKEPHLKLLPVSLKQKGQNISNDLLAGHLSCINDLLGFHGISPHYLEEIILLQLAGILTGLMRDENKFIQHLDDFSKTIFGQKFFKYILLFKGNKELPERIHVLLHKYLLQTLQQEGGLSILFSDVLAAKENNPNFWKHCDVMANILGHKGHTKEFTRCMVNQLYDRMVSHVLGNEDECWLSICINCLLKIKKQSIVAEKFTESFKRLCCPDDLLTGTVVMDSAELKQAVLLIKAAFYQVPGIYLPYEILVPIAPILYELRQRLVPSDVLFPILTNLITKILLDQLNDGQDKLIDELLYNDTMSEGSSFYHLHPRISVMYDREVNSRLVINPADQDPFESESGHFVIFLNECDHHAFIDKVFFHLLQKVAKFYEEEIDDTSSDFIAMDVKELEAIVREKFGKQFIIISTLTSLSHSKPTHNRFRKNAKEVLAFINNLIKSQLKSSAPAPMLISIVLSILSEFCDSKLEHKEELIDSLKLLRKATDDSSVHESIDALLLDLNDGISIEEVLNLDKFEEARQNWQQNAPYIKALGMNQIMKMLKDEDPLVATKKHIILAIALDTLKNDDSYAFLNAINLLVCLTSSLEAEVLEALIAEYQNEAIEVDVRLKCGEAIVKIAQKLGPMAFKYKDLLFDCFLRGSSDRLNEYRVSSLSNLGTMCRLLSYQTNSFFYELLILLESILLNDKHVPARRGAALVLSEFLSGFDKLTDFKEYLLPIYRLLKDLATFDDDYQVTQHAANALENLQTKVIEYLRPDLLPELNIRVFDIKKPIELVKKPYIFELN